MIKGFADRTTAGHVTPLTPLTMIPPRNAILFALALAAAKV